MLLVNSLINWQNDGIEDITERILWIDKSTDIVFVININVNRFPYQRSLQEIESGIKDGFITLLESDAFCRVIDESDIPDKHREIRDKAWKIIHNIIDLEPQVFISKERRKLVLNICELYRVDESTVSNYLKKYWIRGKVKNALLPDYYLCGGKGSEKGISEIKRGRPRKSAGVIGNGINVDEDMKKIFRVAINKFYYTTAKNSLKAAYELMLKEFFSIDMKMKNGIEIPILRSLDEIPSLRQFRYWFQKERDIKKEIKSRRSLKKYEQSHRAIIGDSTMEALGTGSIFQIDATIGDIYLVSRFNRNWIIGRPVIYQVMDVFSRMIVGLYIGLEGPSWNGAAMALANATMNKVEFYKEYGIEISEEEFPCHYLPDSILADRGELEGYNIQNLTNALHIKISNTGSYRSEMKAIIEKNFHIMEDKVKPLLPAMVDQDTRERGDRDKKLDASLTLEEFTTIILKCILYHNNHHYLTHYSREEMMIEDDIEPIPIKLWNWGIQNRSGKLRSVPEDIVKLNLMPTGSATVTAQGIKFKGMYYGSKKVLKEKWFEKARNYGAWSITIGYDMRKMDYIYIKDANGRDFEKCYLLEHQSKYKGKSFEEIEYLLEYEKLQAKKNEELELQSKVELIAEIEHIVKEAKKKTKKEKFSTDSNNKRMKRIKMNRKIEKLMNREHEAFELDKGEEIVESELIHLNVDIQDKKDENNELDLLRRKQKEALKKIYE